MKVAIAGTNGLALWICHFLSTQGFNHQFVLLSRSAKPNLTARGWTLLVVNYKDEADLIYNLAGVDLVISFISGDDQLLLIDAAQKIGVTKFVPSEYGGRPSQRPDSGRQAFALNRLNQHTEETDGMSYSYFVCGVFYERFGPGGLKAENVGNVLGGNEEGDYLMNVGSMRAHIPHDPSGRPAMICMTSLRDVARFIVATLDALNLSQWPRELRMRGDRMSVSDVVRTAESMRDRLFERAEHTSLTLDSALTLARLTHDNAEQVRIRQHMATAAGAYDFQDANLNNMVDVAPVNFENWLASAWNGHLGEGEGS